MSPAVLFISKRKRSTQRNAYYYSWVRSHESPAAREARLLPAAFFLVALVVETDLLFSKVRPGTSPSARSNLPKN